MLFDALKLIQGAFHAYISEVEETPLTQEILILDNIPPRQELGATQNTLHDKVVMSVVNLQEETILKDSPHYHQADGRTIYENPPTSLSVVVLFAIPYCEEYETSLKQLSRVVEFFQGKKVFASTEIPSACTETSHPIKVYADLYSLTFEQLNHLWGALGSKQEPFALYKFQILPLKVHNQPLYHSHVVVADLGAPHRCGNDMLAVNYRLPRPQPIVIRLEKSTFCEDDKKSYEFILEPEGGSLKGDGTFCDEGKYYFQPSRIEGDIVDAKTVTFIYTVEGRYDTCTITVHPKPTGELSIKAGDEFCNDAEPVAITLVDNEPSVYITRIRVNGSRVQQLDPSHFAQDPSQIGANGNYQSVSVAVFLRDRLTKCHNALKFKVKVYPKPDTTFAIVPTGFSPHACLPNNTYCAVREPGRKFLVLQPTAPETSAYFTVNGARVLPHNAAAAGETVYRLDLSNFGQREAQELTVVHHTVAVGTCLARTSDPQTITIVPLPTITISVGGRDQFCRDESPILLTFLADTSTMPLSSMELVQATIDGQVVSAEANGQVLADVQLALHPGQFAHGGDAQTVTIEVQVRDRYTQCENTVGTTVTVYPPPNANFQIYPPTTTGSYCTEAGSLVTFEAADPRVSERFEVTGAIGDDLLAAAWEQGNQLALAKLQITAPLELTITHHARNDAACVAQSEQTITLYPLPSAAFELATTSVCSAGHPVEIRLPSLPESYQLRALTPHGTVIETAIQRDTVDTHRLQFNPRALHPNGTTNYFGETYELPLTIVYEVTGAGGCHNSQSREIVVYRTPDADFDIAFLGEVTLNGATVQITNIQPQIAVEMLSFQWDTNGGSRISYGDQNGDFTVTYNPDELRDRDEIVITLTVFNLGGNLPCAHPPVVKRLLLPDIRDPLDKLLDERLARYRDQLVTLAPALGLGGTEPEDLAERFLTGDRILMGESQAIERYGRQVGGFVSNFFQNHGSIQVASELVVISTASLFDRLVVGDITPTVESRLRESVTEFQEVGLDLTQLLSTWNPDELVEVADQAKLAQLQAVVSIRDGNEAALNALLDQRFTRHRNQLVALAPALGQANASPDDLADRFLTVDRTGISESQAVGLYVRNIESFVRSFLRNGGSTQAASELVALSTASLLDRLVVGDVTDAVTNRLTESLTELQGLGINLNRLPRIWNPDELEDLANSLKLSELRTLLP